MVNFREVKDKVSVSLILDRLGIEYKESQGRYMFCCPFHNDTNPSFAAYESSGAFICFAGCTDNGYDAIDFVARVLNIPLIDAAEWINSGGICQTQQPPRERKKKMEIPNQSEMISFGHRAIKNNHLAVDYLLSRGIPRIAAEKARIGTLDNFAQGGFKVGDEWYAHLPTRWHTIPWFFGPTVYGIKLRRDDKETEKRYAMLDEETVQRYKEVAVSDPIEFDESELIEAIFGPRYMMIAGSRLSGRLYGADQVVKPNGEMIEQDVVFLVEGELDALVGRYVLGVPTVAGKNVKNIDKIKCKKLVIVQDGDQPKLDPRTGQMTSPGKQYATSALLHSGRTEGKDAFIVTPPHKDLNGALQAGELMQWYMSLELGAQ